MSSRKNSSTLPQPKRNTSKNIQRRRIRSLNQEEKREGHYPDMRMTIMLKLLEVGVEGGMRWNICTMKRGD
jgi:hypothetical protein